MVRIREREGNSGIGVVVDVVVHDRPRMFDDGLSDGIDPILLVLFNVRDKVLRASWHGDFEGCRFVDHVLSPLDAVAPRQVDHPSWLRIGGHIVVFEPENLAVFEHKPAATP
jgi:hypothetical protein